MQFLFLWASQVAQCFSTEKHDSHFHVLQAPHIAKSTSPRHHNYNSQIFPLQANHITTSTSSKSRSPTKPPLILHHSSPSPKLNRALCLSDNVTPPSTSSTSAKIPNNRSVSDPGRPRLNGRSRRTRAIFPPCLL